MLFQGFFFIFLILLGVITIAYAIYYGITPTPSTSKARKAIFTLIPKHFKGNVIELGAGWGALAIPLAQQFPTSIVWAYEISPLPWAILWLRSLVGYRNLHVCRRDFFGADLRNVSLVVCYLYPKAMAQLRIKFENELPKGAWVISSTFAIPGWIPKEICYVQDLYRTPIYLYQKT